MKQEQALKILKQGHNVYLGGEPGSGKTHLLTKYISWLKKKKINCGVTASTGIAATYLNGRTIHSFSGLGIKESLDEKQLKRLGKEKRVKKRIGKTKVIIIDEVSMLSAGFLDMLDDLLRYVKGSMYPFGGIQMVFSGDFFQLPPVKKDSYAFESIAWKRLNPLVCYLTEQYRQNDQKLIKILSEIRSGKISQSSLQVLEKRKNLSFKKTITKLFTHNIDVDRINEEKLEELPGEERVFQVKTRGNNYHTSSILKSSIIPEFLKIKKGAEVMFIKNDPQRKYINGTRGKVVEISANPIVKTDTGREIVVTEKTWQREQEGKILGEVTQIPLRLAWAITVHKSQGMTLPEALMDLSRCFTPGQGYVALSRISSLNNLFLEDFNEKALQVEERVRKMDSFFKKYSLEIEKKF